MADELNNDTSLALQLIAVDLENKLDRLGDGIEFLKDRQEEMAIHISKIKEAVYNPEEGIYARLRELEGWKRTHTKLMWLMTSSLIGLITAAIFSNFIPS